MGQKLISVRLKGSSANLCSSEYNPKFTLEVSADGNTWEEVTEYYPNLSAVQINMPVNLQEPQELTDLNFKSLVRSNGQIVSLVDDDKVQWRINYVEDFLTEGQVETLVSGTFSPEA